MSQPFDPMERYNALCDAAEVQYQKDLIALNEHATAIIRKRQRAHANAFAEWMAWDAAHPSEKPDDPPSIKAKPTKESE